MAKCPNPNCEDGQVTVIDNGPSNIPIDTWQEAYPREKEVDCEVCRGEGEIEGPDFVALLAIHHPDSEGIEVGDYVSPDDGYFIYPVDDMCSAIAHGGHLFPLDEDYCVLAKGVPLELFNVSVPMPAPLLVEEEVEHVFGELNDWGGFGDA